MSIDMTLQKWAIFIIDMTLQKWAIFIMGVYGEILCLSSDQDGYIKNVDTHRESFSSK